MLVPSIAISCDPFTGAEAQFRSDWRACIVTLDGNELNSKRICGAWSQAGVVQRYSYNADGELLLNEQGQPVKIDMSGVVTIAAPAHYAACSICRSNWRQTDWWLIAA